MICKEGKNFKKSKYPLNILFKNLTENKDPPKKM